jgi:hypothetical protein
MLHVAISVVFVIVCLIFISIHKLIARCSATSNRASINPVLTNVSL